MKKLRLQSLFPVIGGILLIVTGVVFLLDNLGVIALDWEMVIGPLFVVGGLVFVAVFILNTQNWWALIPAFALMALGTIIFMGNSKVENTASWVGVIFPGFLGLAFLLIYSFHHEQWWALFPGGVLLTFSAVSLIPDNLKLSGALYFVGLALTFGLVYLLPKPAGKLTWALYPAGILLVIGVLVLLGATNLMDYVWPIALMIGGGFVLYRALKK